ncbi:sulfatase-like hydrolase/transferase [Vibrio kasasachensis]|uniref:LTA synthase family protein n=1 Tax=Vibrio kasasachensis TaxID=2910248 RepID=UPI003D121CD8
MYQNNAQKLIRIIWIQVALFAFLLSVFRQIFTFSVGDISTISTVLPDYFQSIIIGLRFDLRVATMAFAPLFLIGLLLAGSKYFTYVKRSLLGYSSVIYFLAAAVSIGNYYYYKTYGNYFDIFVFGLVEDDTSAVLLTMWQDYPILISFLISILIMLGATKIIKYRWKAIDSFSWPKRNSFVTALFVLITISVYFVLARGSIGTFPLKQYHANVSSYEILNKATPNAFLALDWARSNHKKSATFKPVSKLEYEQQMQQVLGQVSPIYHTSKNGYLEKNQPHVVFALMESMGTNLLTEDNNNGTDLLGALRPHYEHDFSFERFLSGTDGTINSIVMMLFHSNIGSISHGSEQKTVLPDTAFLPYKKAGYQIVYITGGSPLWRNLKYYLPIQGVDKFYSEDDIYQAFPESIEHANTWGATDEYTFKFAEDILKNSSQPTMIMVQTQTNHPPYQIPSNYTPNKIEVSDHVMNKVSLNEDKSKKIYETYQYAANSLGEFITDIKNTELGDKTIIAASGDHRLRDYSISLPADLGTAHSVPFYLYVPEPILEHSSYQYQKNRIGSHRDIFPTLYAYSLSEAEYISLGGRNLLAETDIQTPYAYNNGITLTQTGATYNSNEEVIYPWKDDEGLSVETKGTPNPTPHLDEEYIKLQTLFINAQIKGFNAE